MESTIQYIITNKLNKLIYTENLKPGDFFCPGNEFHKNAKVLQVLCLHSTLGKCFATTNFQIVSVFLSNSKFSTINIDNNGTIKISIKRNQILREIFLQVTKKNKNNFI